MIAYFFKKGQRKYKDFKSKKTNLLQNQSAPAVHQANKLFLNNLDFNPEIYTTALYLGFVFTLIPTIISINYFRPMNFNPNVISSFSSPLIINFVLPLYTFVIEDVFPFLENFKKCKCMCQWKTKVCLKIQYALLQKILHNFSSPVQLRQPHLASQYLQAF